MSKRRTRNFVFVFLLLSLTLPACTSVKFEQYEGKPLTILVIGEPPQVREKQVNFTTISFDDLNTRDLENYDAVFIMEEHLKQAAESQYAEIYSHSPTPFFFVSTTSHVPFTHKDIEYEDIWDWSPGNIYIAGVLKLNEDDSRESWGFGLYNETKTEKHIEDVYSRIFIKLGELDSSS